MTAHARIRVVVYRHNSGPLPAATGESLCSQVKIPNGVETTIAAGTAQFQALNRAASGTHAEVLAFAPSGSRLHARFLTRCLEALDADPRVMAVFTGHTGGDAAGLPYATVGGFRTAQLLRRNAVGPAFAVRRSAWDDLRGLRTDLRLSLWDFWLRLGLRYDDPQCIRRLPELLACCPPEPCLSMAEDGRAKALLVVHTPGAFAPDVCRWALALLRGESWARPFQQGLVPCSAEVRRMWSDARGAAQDARPLRCSA